MKYVLITTAITCNKIRNLRVFYDQELYWMLYIMPFNTYNKVVLFPFIDKKSPEKLRHMLKVAQLAETDYEPESARFQSMCLQSPSHFTSNLPVAGHLIIMVLRMPKGLTHCLGALDSG